MSKLRILATIVLALTVFALPVPAGAERSPEDTVRQYLKALQEARFADAYQYVSAAMRRDKNQEEWAKEQQYIVQMGEVKIFGFQVFDAIMVEGKAKVPNILKSQDKYLNQLGLDEHEVYELVKEDSAWRIDQQMLVNGAEQREFFPDE